MAYGIGALSFVLSLIIVINEIKIAFPKYAWLIFTIISIVPIFLIIKNLITYIKFSRKENKDY